MIAIGSGEDAGVTFPLPGWEITTDEVVRPLPLSRRKEMKDTSAHMDHGSDS
jgi:hypothetical protein